MTQASPPAERDRLADNLRRLMARFGLSLAGLVKATGLDERTIRSVLHGKGRPHARTLHKLATGLGVDADELFEDVRAAESAAAAAFDRQANPAVAELVDQQPELFARWAPHEFDELYSRVAVGGQLTPEGALAATHAMNRRRELLAQVALILETSEAERLEEYVALLYRRATTIDDGAYSSKEHATLEAAPRGRSRPPSRSDISPGVNAGVTNDEPTSPGPFTDLLAKPA